MGGTEVRIERDRLLEELPRLGHRLRGVALQLLAAAHVKVVGIDVGGAAPADARGFVRREVDLERVDDGARHLVLDFEDVDQLAVIALRPEMRAAASVDELRRDAHARPGLAHASFQHMAHAEVARDAPQIDGAALVGEGRIARDHHQPRHLRQIGDQVFADAVGEVILFSVAGHVVERQHHD